MIKSVIAVLAYVLSRVLFVGAMVGLPTAALYLPKLFQESIKKQEKMAIGFIYGYAIVLTGILLAIVLKKAGL